MKYLNFALIGLLVLLVSSCGEQKKTETVNKAEEVVEDAMENIEEAVDGIMDDEEDASDYLESAMLALNEGNNTLAASEVLNAIKVIKKSLQDDEVSEDAKLAVMKLSEINASLASGTQMTGKELASQLSSLSYFEYEDFDFDGDDDYEDEDDGDEE